MIDRNKVYYLREMIQNKIQELVQEEFSFRLGNATFSKNNVTFKLEVNTINQDGTINTKEASDFKLCAPMYGLSPDNLGSTFIHKGQEYTIVGLSVRSRKYPIICEKEGNSYKFATETIKKCLENQKHSKLGFTYSK